jgi:hypothetical protein
MFRVDEAITYSNTVIVRRSKLRLHGGNLAVPYCVTACLCGLPLGASRSIIRLEVQTQIKLLKLADEEMQDELPGFVLACSFDLREIGPVYDVIASPEQLADVLRSIVVVDCSVDPPVCIGLKAAMREGA